MADLSLGRAAVKTMSVCLPPKQNSLPPAKPGKRLLYLEFLKNLGYSDSVLSKTAIFPKKEGRKREISNESARGSSLHETDF